MNENRIIRPPKYMDPKLKSLSDEFKSHAIVYYKLNTEFLSPDKDNPSMEHVSRLHEEVDVLMDKLKTNYIDVFYSATTQDKAKSLYRRLSSLLRCIETLDVRLEAAELNELENWSE